MKFDTIPAGETRQYDGPWFGVRVLSTGSGAALLVDRVALPVGGLLPTYEGKTGTVIATGPLVLALAESFDEDVTKASASPAPPPLSIVRELYVSAVAQGAGWTIETLNPGSATRLDVNVRNPNAAATLSFAVKIADADGVYRLTGSSDLDVSRTAAAGNLWTSLMRMGRGSAGASTGFQDAAAGAGISHAMPPSRIKLVSTAPVDAAKQATIEVVWAP